MSFAKTAVERPTTIFIIFALLIGLGVFALVNLPIDLTPEINPPYLFVLTTYSGAGPEEVERSVTRPLEAALSGVSGLEKITTTSAKGSSQCIMQFTFGTDLVDASNSVRDALERVRRVLPTGADTPSIFRFSPSMIPIMGLMVKGNRDSAALRELAENTIVPRIEQTPGVATASVSGGREKIIRVEIPQTRLEAYGLTMTQLQQMLASQNVQVSAGTITDDGLSYLLTTMGEYGKLDDIRNTVISYKGGGVSAAGASAPRPIFLRDLADVTEGYRDETSTVYVDGEAAVQLTVQKQSGKNSVQVAKDLRARVKRMESELPADIKISELYNTTDQVETSIAEVVKTGVSGALLAVAVLFVFLRSMTPTIIIGISIPVSIVITLLFMYFANMTLNLMTLAGMVLGIGMLVDNSIVILENIYHYREKGAKLKPAAILGTSEMLVAIVASTLTTICVFAPLVMFQGLLEMAGEMFAGLAFTVVISLAISLFTAAVLVPVLSSHYLPLVTRRQQPLKNRFLKKLDSAFDGFFKWLDEKYRHGVDRVLRHKLIFIIVLLAALVGSLTLIPKIGWQFMPSQEPDAVEVSITTQLGTPLAETESVLWRLAEIVKREVNGYKTLILSAGGGGGMMSLGGSSSNQGSLRIELPPLDERIDRANDIKEKIRAHYGEFPGVQFDAGGGGGMSMMGGGSAIDIVIRTEDLVKGKELAQKISDIIKEKVANATEPSVSIKDGLPQVEIELDRDRMYDLGLNVYAVGNEIRAAVDGITATKYKASGQDYDVVLIFAEADRNSLPSLDHIFVNSQITGQRIPLSSFASYSKGTGPLSISRENQSRVVHVTAGAKPGTKSNLLEAEVRRVISANVPQEDGVIIEYAGDNSEFVKIFIRFLLIVVVAFFLVFGVMASLFESFRDPFIVIFTIPLSLIGVILIYLITGDMFNVLTAVGFLVLLGVIVNNGIVLVDYTNLLRKRGFSLHDACVEAAGNRLRPILMSTLTTIIGLAPMAFIPGEGSEITAPIGKTVLGGLSFGTIMTLFLMPVIYAIINKRGDERAAKAEARRQRIAQGLKGKAK